MMSHDSHLKGRRLLFFELRLLDLIKLSPDHKIKKEVMKDFRHSVDDRSYDLKSSVTYGDNGLFG